MFSMDPRTNSDYFHIQNKLTGFLARFTISESEHELCHGLSVRPSAWNKSVPTGWIFMKTYLRIFSKICPESSRFIKI